MTECLVHVIEVISHTARLTKKEWSQVAKVFSRLSSVVEGLVEV